MENIECSICMNTLNDKYSTICNHDFCKSCISKWLKNNFTCPYCRTYIY